MSASVFGIASRTHTPKGLRLHIGLFGRRNAGKSSLINALTNQKIAIVSDVPGTTTDPVEKACELAPIGPVVLIDTAGVDDTGELGGLRIERSLAVLGWVDVALIVCDAKGLTNDERSLIATVKKTATPAVIVLNKADTASTEQLEAARQAVRTLGYEPVVACAKCLVVRESRLAETLANEKEPPAFVMTDSQVVQSVVANTPAHIPVTTFSIQMAYSKSDLVEMARGAAAIDFLKPGDKVMVCETCSHHPQADDIGRKKLPRWLATKAGGELDMEVVVGKDFPADLTPYKLILQCGGCVVTRRHMLTRLEQAKAQGVPMTNYGVAISHLQGVLERALELHPQAMRAFQEARQAFAARAR